MCNVECHVGICSVMIIIQALNVYNKILDTFTPVLLYKVDRIYRDF